MLRMDMYDPFREIRSLIVSRKGFRVQRTEIKRLLIEWSAVNVNGRNGANFLNAL